jgi:DHA2 family multidrug resistance protein
VVFFLLVRNTQTVHSSFAEMLRTRAGGPVSAAIASATPNVSLSALNEAITHQSAFIAYIDDFRLMAIVTIATLPFVFLLRGGRARTSAAHVLD